MAAGWVRLFLIVLSSFVFAITGNAQEKVNLQPEIWPEFQTEFVLKNTDFIYFRNQYRYDTNPASKDLGKNFPGNHLERIQFRLGYEHLINNTWSIGGSEMYGIESDRKLLFTDVYVRHLNSFAGLQITERLVVDYLYYSNTSTRVGRLRPRVDVDKIVKLGNLTIRPRAGYELFLNTDFRSGTRSSPRTRLRLEVGFLTSPHFSFAPYFLKQTDYTITPDHLDDQTHTLVKGHKRNLILPVWGVEMRYTFFQGKTPFSRLPIPPVQQD